ncbi:hypothetical protein BJ912DRAFT_1068412 [Pholiota molesta]|nr:hypothetical protein BJ912DRAFT_1068412 [Pholiota molesta]
MPAKVAKVSDATGTPPAPKGPKLRTTSNSRQTADYAPVGTTLQPTPRLPHSRRASMEEVEDPDSPKGPPRAPSPGRPILERSDARDRSPATPIRSARSIDARGRKQYKEPRSNPAVVARGPTSKPASVAASPGPAKGSRVASVTKSAQAPKGSLTADVPQSAVFLQSPTRASSRSNSPSPRSPTEKRTMMEVPKSIFDGITVMNGIVIYDEPLQASVSRLHPPWIEFSEDVDPLDAYGGVDGMLEGRPAEEALWIRDILIRWTYPDLDCNYENLPNLVETVTATKLTVNDLIEYNSITGTKFYSFHSKLLDLGLALQALTQILRAFTDFFYGHDASSFYPDRDFKLLRLLAWHTQPEEMVATYKVLQRRCSLAVVHVTKHLNKIKKVFLLDREEAFSVSSYNSTTGSERIRIDDLSPRSTLRTYLSRDDFASDFVGEDTVLRANVLNNIESSSELFKPTPYTHRSYTPALNQSADAVSERLKFINERSTRSRPEEPDSISGFLAQRQVTFAPPTPHFASTSISSINRQHPVSSLPGVGTVPTIKIDTFNNSGGPTAAWGGSTWGGPSVQPTKGILPNVSNAATFPSTSNWSSYQFSHDANSSKPNDPSQPPGNGPPDGGPPNPGGFHYPGGEAAAAAAEAAEAAAAAAVAEEVEEDLPAEDLLEEARPVEDPRTKAVVRPMILHQAAHTQINLSSLPVWNGNGDTIIDYVSETAAFAAMSDNMNTEIGQLAPLRWTDRAKKWWESLTSENRKIYGQNWNHLLFAIRAHFMNENWTRLRMQEFEEMKFRQKNHSTEHPLDFIQRRIRSHSFLFPTDSDGPAAISRILRTQPTEWGTLLNELVTPNMMELQATAERMEQTLETSYLLHENLRRASDPKAYTTPYQDSASEDEKQNETSTNKEAHAASSSRPRGSRAPATPRPGSNFPEGRTINVQNMLIEIALITEDFPYYAKLTIFDSIEFLSCLYDDSSSSPDITKDAMNAEVASESESGSDSNLPPRNRNERRRVKFEQEKSANTSSPSLMIPRKVRRKSSLRRTKSPVEQHSSTSATKDGSPLVIPAKKSRALPEGLGSLGTQALRIKVRVASLHNPTTEARLDSGADITLISEDFYNSLTDVPELKEGLRMKLYHLTGHAKVLGYTRTTLFAPATDNTIVSFEMEAYVVRGMRVPILIGEDFQTTYEIGLTRHASGKSEVLVGRNTPKVIEASSAIAWT